MAGADAVDRNRVRIVMEERLTLRARLARLAREAGKFGAVGAVGTLVNVAVFNLCIRGLGLAPVRSGVIATAVAIAANYVGNRYWTYRHCDKSRVRREATLFVLFSAIGMVIENGALAVSHYGLGFTSPLADNVAKYVIGLGLGTCFRFWSYRTWVFRAAGGDAADGAPDGAAERTAAPGNHAGHAGSGAARRRATVHARRTPAGRTRTPRPRSARRRGAGSAAGLVRLSAQEQREDRRSLL